MDSLQTPPLLREALDSIGRDRGKMRLGQATGFDSSQDAVSSAIAYFGEDGLADAVYAATPPSEPWELLADFLGIAVWHTSDNGSRISRDCEGWLVEATNRRKVLIALHLEVYPFLDASRMTQVLEAVATKFPDAAGQCRALITSRRKIPE